MSELSLAIVAARKGANVSLRATAVAVDISPALLSLIEQGKHVPPREVVIRLALHLRADPDQWCGLAGRISDEAESSFARLAAEKPEYFRFLRSLVSGVQTNVPARNTLGA